MRIFNRQSIGYKYILENLSNYQNSYMSSLQNFAGDSRELDPETSLKPPWISLNSLKTPEIMVEPRKNATFISLNIEKK